MAKSVRRLYKELKPEHYTLRLTPNMHSMTFEGVVTVALKKTGRPSQRLTFHQNGLKITGAEIIKHDKKGDQQLTITRVNNQNTLHEVRLHTKEMVYSGSYRVTMRFSGKINRTMVGLYPCYFTLNGQEHIMLSTQFESHYARNVFPCIDEPEAKATFDLTLVAPKDLTVLANTPVTSEEQLDDSDLLATTFETTPKMSTYLLAFAIGELQSVSTETNRGVGVGVWATIAQPLSALEFALDVAKRSIEFFEDYFGVSYPLAKLDHVGVPDFSMGAMENWGLITYRERRILAYEGETSQAVQEQIAMTIVHETAHMWFGDLVTMKWWDEIWLNESFARLMESQCLDTLFPEWQMWDNFAASVGLISLRRDATPGVQAVHTAVHHPDEINTLFDPAIVYGKGARILNMLKAYIGEEAFRKGLSAYFKQHAYSNTTAADLWSALSNSSGLDVAAFMDPWLERSGFPVITIDQSDKQVHLSQQQFLESGEHTGALPWPVPLFANHTGLPTRLDKASKTFLVKTTKPVLLNVDSAGHYITYYKNERQRQALENMISAQEISVRDRLLLLNSESMLAKAGYEPFAQVLALLDAFEHEQSAYVWNMISVIISEAKRFIDLDESIEAPLKAFINSLIAPEYKRLGWDERAAASAADRKLRATIIGLGSYADNQTIVDQAISTYKQYQSSDQVLPAETRGTIFAMAIREQVPEAFEFLLKQHDTTISNELQSDIMVGLCATRDVAQAGRLLDRLTNASIIKAQDALYWLAYLQMNRYTRETAWNWMVKHWSWLEDTYKHDMLYDRLPKYAADVCATKVWLKKFDEFFTPKRDDKGIARNIEVGLNEIRTRVAWLERDLPSVQRFFKQSTR